MKSTKICHLYISFLMIFLPHSLTAATLTVCTSGCDHATISAAVTAASSGDILNIAAETFTESNILINKNLTLEGSGQTTTIVQANAAPNTANDGVFRVSGAVTVVFQDLTIRHGNAVSTGASANTQGGGVNITASSGTNVSFTRVSITENRASGDGGGIIINGASGTVSFIDSVLSNNEADATNFTLRGGGLRNLGASNLSMVRCTISGNAAGRHAGGVDSSIDATTTAEFINCTVYGNSAGSSGNTNNSLGGGIFLGGNNSTTAIINCTIVNNSLANNGGNVLRGGGIFTAKSHAVSLINSIVANNTGTAGIEGADYRENATINAVVNNTLIESCSSCNTAATYTTDPNLAPVAFCGVQAYFVPQSPSNVLDNGTAPGGNIPTDDICGRTRIAPHDLGSMDVSAIPEKPEVPTLSQWGLIILALLLLTFGTIYLVQPSFRSQITHR